jgi:hypothetical protein
VAVMANARVPTVLAVDVLVMVVDFVAHATLSSKKGLRIVSARRLF